MAEKIYLLNKATMREMKKCTGALTYKQQAVQVRTHFRICVRTCVYIFVTYDGFCVFFCFFYYQCWIIRVIILFILNNT